MCIKAFIKAVFTNAISGIYDGLQSMIFSKITNIWKKKLKFEIDVEKI